MENSNPPIIETSEQPARKTSQIIRDYVVLLLGAGSIIFLDTWTKILVDKNIPVGGAWLPHSMSQFLKYFRVTHFHNKGTAFSMFADADQINTIISILAVVVSLVIISIYPRINRGERVLRVAILLQLGGTIGNLISRIQYGYVLDFISVGNFAVFNIADSSLVVGAGLMVLAVLVEEISEIRKKKVEPEENEEISGDEQPTNLQ